MGNRGRDDSVHRPTRTGLFSTFIPVVKVRFSKLALFLLELPQLYVKRKLVHRDVYHNKFDSLHMYCDDQALLLEF